MTQHPDKKLGKPPTASNGITVRAADVYRGMEENMRAAGVPPTDRRSGLMRAGCDEQTADALIGGNDTVSSHRHRSSTAPG